ncbi:MAG: DUF6612 family protein, partial [Tumebacillaceae bacterium]
LTLYAKGELKALPANLAKNGPLSAEMYLVDNNWYFKDSQSQKWNYLKLTTKQINNYMQSVADMESHMSANLESLLPYLSLTETADSYTITAKLDNKGLDQLNKFDPSFHGNVSNIDYDYFPIKYKAIIDLSIDKSTYLAKEVMGTYTEHDTFLRSNVTTTLSLYGTIGMYDRIPAIKIPDDVAKAIADDKTKSDN